MQNLRNAHLLARFVLVWFALFIGVAVASPLVNPEGLQRVCSATGSVKWVQPNANGDDALNEKHGTHCPLCLPVAAPPVASVEAWVHVGLSFALHPKQQAHLAWLTRQPWQARAPPTFS
jgi:hypothetical protein